MCCPDADEAARGAELHAMVPHGSDRRHRGYKVHHCNGACLRHVYRLLRLLLHENALPSAGADTDKHHPRRALRKSIRGYELLLRGGNHHDGFPYICRASQKALRAVGRTQEHLRSETVIHCIHICLRTHYRHYPEARGCEIQLSA